MIIRGLRSFLIALLLAVALPTYGDPARAQPAESNDPGAGSRTGGGDLSYSVPIEVPEFHRLEPSLLLAYNSSHKAGLDGFYQGRLISAWGLDGFDLVGRVSSGFDATGGFLLSGE